MAVAASPLPPPFHKRYDIRFNIKKVKACVLFFFTTQSLWRNRGIFGMLLMCQIIMMLWLISDTEQLSEIEVQWQAARQLGS